jgi:hypothetical protein
MIRDCRRKIDFNQPVLIFTADSHRFMLHLWFCLLRYRSRSDSLRKIERAEQKVALKVKTEQMVRLKNLHTGMDCHPG